MGKAVQFGFFSQRTVYLQNWKVRLIIAVAEPGFCGGGVSSKNEGIKLLFGQISPRKLHENERSWTGGVPG